ncbi:hypothetical protein LTR86_009694 [Recurvomyces mirabilis]|nr:hypothetical protein LTR86_009694 [Recurvomyces mirabilis]
MRPGEAHPAREVRIAKHPKSRCATPESTPSLASGSDETSNCSTLPSFTCAAYLADPQDHDVDAYIGLGTPSQIAAAPTTPSRLDAHSLQLFNTMNDAAREDGEFDSAIPIVAWDMGLDDPWTSVKVKLGCILREHAAYAN